MWLSPKCLAFALSVWLTAASLLAGPPTLSRLVPDDAGLCLSAENLAAHLDRFEGSPLRARWQSFPPLAQWTRENQPELERIGDEVGRQLGIDVEDVAQRVFGQQSLVAIWPPVDPAEKRGSGLLLVEAADPASLAALLSGVRAAQQRAGELRESHQVTYHGLIYEERLIEHRGEKVRLYLAVLDRIGVLASHAEIIKRVLGLHRAGPTGALCEAPTYRAAMEQVDASAPLKLFINPRAWDAVLTRGLPAEGQRLGRGQQLLHQAWRRLQFAGFSLRLEPEVRLEALLSLDQPDDAADLTEVLASFAGSPTLMEHIPADCLAAAVGNIDLSRLVHWLQRPVAAEEKPAPAVPKRSFPEVVWSILDGTFQGVGPGMGGFVSAASRESPYPLAAVGAVQINRHAAEGAGNLKPAEGLKSLLEAAVALQAKQAQPPPQVKSRKTGELELVTVSQLPDVPAGVEPSFGFRNQAMLVGSEPNIVARAALLPREDSLAASAGLRRTLGPRLTAPTQMAWLNVGRLRRFLAANAERVVTAVSHADEEESEKTRRGLKDLAPLLGLADVAAIAAQVESGSLRLVVAVAVDPTSD